MTEKVGGEERRVQLAKDRGGERASERAQYQNKKVMRGQCSEERYSSPGSSVYQLGDPGRTWLFSCKNFQTLFPVMPPWAKAETTTMALMTAKTYSGRAGLPKICPRVGKSSIAISVTYQERKVKRERERQRETGRETDQEDIEPTDEDGDEDESGVVLVGHIA
jgi:hypothetical protein